MSKFVNFLAASTLCLLVAIATSAHAAEEPGHLRLRNFGTQSILVELQGNNQSYGTRTLSPGEHTDYDLPAKETITLLSGHASPSYSMQLYIYPGRTRLFIYNDDPNPCKGGWVGWIGS